MPILSLLVAAAAAASAVTTLLSISSPPEPGPNTITLTLPDDSIPSALFYMPAMGAMPRMETRGRVSALGARKHRIDFDLSMGGTWELELTLTTTSTSSTAPRILRYSLTTGIPGIADRNSSLSTTSTTDLTLTPERIQRTNVRFATATITPMHRTVRAFGAVEQDKTRRGEVAAPVAGRIVKQHRRRIGDHVKAGDPLFSLQSPDLDAAQADLLAATATATSATSATTPTPNTTRLERLGLTPPEIAQLLTTRKPHRTVTYRAPVAGTIIDINAAEGVAVEPGRPVFVIGDTGDSHIVARIFQQDAADLLVGQRAHIQPADAPDRIYEGVIAFLFPQLQPGAGTGNIRVALRDRAPELQPGTFAELRFDIPLGDRLTIPAEAVLHSGQHTYVFVDHGNGVLRPTRIAVGKRASGLVEVRSGLAPGDRVAASGTFLLGSEAQLRSALPKWGEVAP